MGASVVRIDAPRLREQAAREGQELPEMRFVIVAPNDVGMWWDYVERTYADVCGAMRKRDGSGREVKPAWDLDRLRSWLEEPRAHLSLTFHDRRVVGLTVLCRDGDQFATAFDWLVLVAWSDPENVRRGIARHVKHFTQASIEEAARRVGAQRLKMYSAREGWLRGAKELGYELAYHAYVKEL